jgi:hypothetical protein
MPGRAAEGSSATELRARALGKELRARIADRRRQPAVVISLVEKLAAPDAFALL